ncbi:MAG: hydrogenase small subunit [Chitinophagales bacterium]
MRDRTSGGVGGRRGDPAPYPIQQFLSNHLPPNNTYSSTGQDELSSRGRRNGLKVSRRDFLKWAAASATAIGLTQADLGKLSEVFAAAGRPPVVWLSGSGCSGCSVSLLNTVNPPIDSVLLDTVSLLFHPTVMAGAGERAMETLDDVLDDQPGEFVLVIEGGVPTAEGGRYCYIGECHGREWTMLDAISVLAPKAKAVVAAGTCAAFGGIPGGRPNPTGIVRVDRLVKSVPVVNLPGCPAHPDWMVTTLVEVFLKGVPRLDSQRRPVAFYGRTVHSQCPRRFTWPARNLGDSTCLQLLGCNGPTTSADCPRRKWNAGTNWCVQSGTPCIGCASPVFPDGCEPFYKPRPLMM